MVGSCFVSKPIIGIFPIGRVGGNVRGNGLPTERSGYMGPPAPSFPLASPLVHWHVRAMTLPDFILAHTETILREWEAFARSIWPGPAASGDVLRDHAKDMLIAVASDMKSSQTISEQAAKSKGLGGMGLSKQGEASDQVDSASKLHALSRLSSGFELRELVVEYRALRASVIQLWVPSLTEPGADEMLDIIRCQRGH